MGGGRADDPSDPTPATGLFINLHAWHKSSGMVQNISAGFNCAKSC